jgi:hypothetical protein
MGIFKTKKELDEVQEELTEEPPTDPGIEVPEAIIEETQMAPPSMKEGEVTGIYRMALESVDANLLEKKVTLSKAVRIREHATAQAQRVRAKASKK